MKTEIQISLTCKQPEIKETTEGAPTAMVVKGSAGKNTEGKPH